jgi:hypothetical protein
VSEERFCFEKRVVPAIRDESLMLHCDAAVAACARALALAAVALQLLAQQHTPTRLYGIDGGVQPAKPR